MAKFRGKGSMKKLDLIATYLPSQITRDDAGKMTGAYVTIQKDQSTLTQKAVREGTVEADSNPYIESHTVTKPDGQFTSHGVWYTRDQIAMMGNAGTHAKNPETGEIAMAFNADVGTSTNKKGVSRMIVLLPKDISKIPAKDKASIAKAQEYNAKHELGPSSNKGFSLESLDKQAKITQIAKDIRAKERAAQAQNQAEAQAQTQNQNQAQQAAPPDLFEPDMG